MRPGRFGPPRPVRMGPTVWLAVSPAWRSDLVQMPQLVGVPHHIDCRDLSVLDCERGRRKFTIGLERDETGQSVDETGTNKFRTILPETSRQIFMNLHDGIETEDRLRGCRTLAAAVGMKADISRQHRAKRLHFAAARGGEKGLGKREATLFFHLEARSRLSDASARAGGELAASRGVTLDGLCDLLESQPEHIVQQ